MKKLLFYLLALPLFLGVVSCSEEKDEPNVLTVNLSEVILTAEENDAQELTIASTSPWTLTGGADWLHISATSGTGTSTIKLATKSLNNSSNGRSTTLTISSSGLTCQVLVKQEPGKVVNCTAEPSKVVALSNGIACNYKFGSQVSFYISTLGKKSEGDCLTNDEIYNELLTNGKRNTPNESYVSVWDGLEPLTEYNVYTIAFDKNGKPGDMVVKTIKTKSDKDQAYILISLEGIDENNWHYSTTTNAYCIKYYHMAWSATNAEDAYINYPDAYLAWLLKDKNDSSKPLSLAQQGQTWHLERDKDDTYFHAFTWGLDANNELSGIITRASATASTDDKEIKHFDMSKETSKKMVDITISYDEYQKAKSSMIKYIETTFFLN